ncbi:MAG: LptA/OstA family protein [Cyanobacteria bacterium J06626_18]
MTAGVQAQTDNGGSITLRSDIQEANAVTGVITARGNVQIDYPAQQIYATSAQAQFFNEERRIILSGDVVVLQEGNRLEAETVTYLIDEGRFVALPQPNEQVQTTYILPPSEDPAAEPASDTNPQAAPADGGAPLTEPIEPDAMLEISPIEASNTP